MAFFNREDGGSVLDGIRDRLGFGAEEEAFDEELYGEDYDAYADNFDDFSTYDSDEYEDEEEPRYTAVNPVSTRTSGSSWRNDAGYGTRREISHPSLVSLEDVRNSTRIPDSLNRDPLPPRSSNNLGRNVVGHASDYALSGSEVEPGYSAASAEVGTARSGGFDTSTDATSGSQNATAPISSAGGYDPYNAYEAGGTYSHRPTRTVSVLSPVAYGEVENVARMLRAGDAVVLSLRNTPSQLSKRILDFAFGVASALEASVDCIADKVFAITRGEGLDENELARLRSQGVI